MSILIIQDFTPWTLLPKPSVTIYWGGFYGLVFCIQLNETYMVFKCIWLWLYTLNFSTGLNIFPWKNGTIFCHLWDINSTFNGYYSWNLCVLCSQKERQVKYLKFILFVIHLPIQQNNAKMYLLSHAHIISKHVIKNVIAVFITVLKSSVWKMRHCLAEEVFLP